MTTFILTGNSSTLSCNFHPPIEVHGNYSLGLINYHTFNTIPNIDANQNTFKIGKHSIVLPTGSYEFKQIKAYILKELEKINKNTTLTNNNPITLEINANHSTLLCELQSNVEIDFTIEKSLRNLLGFKNVIIKPNTFTQSYRPINIFDINIIKITCNLISGSFENGKSTHTIYTFFPKTPSGFRILESACPIIHFPINTTLINKLIIQIVDQHDRLIDFRGENQAVTLHLKKTN